MPITPTSGLVAIGITMMMHHSVLVGTPGPLTEWYNEGNISDAGNPGRGLYSLTIAETSGTYDLNPTFSVAKKWGSISAVFVCSGSGLDCPDSGQWKYDVIPTPTPDGSTTTFTIPCRYADGSLKVRVDDTNQLDAVTVFDGAAGTFTLGFAPEVGELLVVDHQGR